MADITINSDGSADIVVHIEPEKMAPLLYKFPDLNAVVSNLEDPAVEAAAAMELSAAEEWYQSGFAAGDNDGSLFLKKPELVAQYRASPDYETAAERLEREAREEADLESKVEEAEQELRAAVAALG